MKLGDGLFLNVCKEIAKEYESSGIAFDSMIVDNTLVSLLRSRKALKLAAADSDHLFLPQLDAARRQAPAVRRHGHP
jgi:hypothetical protein